MALQTHQAIGGFSTDVCPMHVRASREYDQSPSDLVFVQAPLAMDCSGSHIVIASEPLELLVLELQLPRSATAPAGSGTAKPASAAAARLVPVRELSMFNVGRPLLDIALVPELVVTGSRAIGPGAAGQNGSTTQGSSTSSLNPTSLSKAASHSRHPSAGGPSPKVGSSSHHGPASVSSESSVDVDGSSSSTRAVPTQCVLLRWGGLMSLLNMQHGAELALSGEVSQVLRFCWLLNALNPIT